VGQRLPVSCAPEDAQHPVSSEHCCRRLWRRCNVTITVSAHYPQPCFCLIMGRFGDYFPSQPKVQTLLSCTHMTLIHNWIGQAARTSFPFPVSRLPSGLPLWHYLRQLCSSDGTEHTFVSTVTPSVLVAGAVTRGENTAGRTHVCAAPGCPS
jgi:hypothetical protein